VLLYDSTSQLYHVYHAVVQLTHDLDLEDHQSCQYGRPVEPHCGQYASMYFEMAKGKAGLANLLRERPIMIKAIVPNQREQQ
jgi:hypothetical protein